MRRVNTITNFHRNAPRKLIRLYKKNGGNCYKVGKQIGVNASHVWNLLKNGVEPKREDLRQKLFIRRTRRRAVTSSKPKTEAPEHVRKWRRLPKEERYKVIQQYMNWRNSHGSNIQKEDTAESVSN